LILKLYLGNEFYIMIQYNFTPIRF